MKRLDRLESREAIAGLVHGYVRAMRANGPEGTSTLFAPDSFVEILDGHPYRQEFTARDRFDRCCVFTSRTFTIYSDASSV